MTVSINEMLENIPSLLLMWTMLTLMWSLYINVSFVRMMQFADKYRNGRRLVDRCNAKFLIMANVFLFLYLFFRFATVDMFGGAMFIINIFLNTYLISASVTIHRWHKSKTKFLKTQEEIDTSQHILT